MRQENAKLQKKMSRMIAKWNRSGVTLKAFSKAEGVSYSKLKYWKQKFNRSNLNTVQQFTKAPQDIPDFISVEIPNTSDLIGLELRFPNNVEITCTSGIGLEELKTQ